VLRSRVLAVLLAVCVLWAPVAASADEFVLHFIPEGTPIEIEGTKYRAFGLEEYKLLIALDLRLYSDEKVMDELERRIGLEEERNLKLQGIIDNYTTAYFEMGVELTRAYDQSDEWMERALNAEMPKVWPWVVLGIGAGLGLLGVGLSIGASVQLSDG